jgi:hypothetical protein
MYLDQAVINLHDIARLIEQQIGVGKLSEDIRNCADRLNELLKPVDTKSDNYDPVI